MAIATLRVSDNQKIRVKSIAWFDSEKRSEGNAAMGASVTSGATETLQKTAEWHRIGEICSVRVEFQYRRGSRGSSSGQNASSRGGGHGDCTWCGRGTIKNLLGHVGMKVLGTFALFAWHNGGASARARQ
jgi:hypothetical protein